MKLFAATVVLASSLAPAGAGHPLTALPSPDSCGPASGLSFVCGLQRPEDIVPVPETRWLIAGSMVPGGGLAAVDIDAKRAYALYDANTPKARDRHYPGCAGAPDPAKFATHGLNLRQTAPGRFVLAAVSHSPAESVQVFALDVRGDVPSLVWKGCVAIPGSTRTNSVAAFADGSMLVTIFGGLAHADGTTGGAVYAWKPGEREFRELAGTELPAPNGIEASPDGQSFYVVSSTDQTFHVFARDGRELRAGKTPDIFADNLHWSGNRLLVAGMMRDEPACGGLFVMQDPRSRNCNRGYIVAAIDPAGLGWNIVAYAEPNPMFGGVATGAIVGDTLWLSSWKDGRIAYRPLPHLPPGPP